MKRNLEKNAQKGAAILGAADMTASEINELGQMILAGDMFEALGTAFCAGAYVGYKKGRAAGKGARK